MKSIYLLLVIFLIQQVAGGQVREMKPTPTPERPRATIALLNDARLAAPELAVDTFIKVAQSRKITEAAWRLEMLEEALRMADEVNYPVRRTVIPVKGMHVDTHAGYLSYAYDLKLDSLSLKSRILNELIKVNKDRARQVVFEMGGKLGLKPLKCTETLAYDVADIYPVVGVVAKEVFSSKEVAEGIRAHFVAPWMENIESPSQIGPALDLLAQFRGSEAEKFLLFAALSKAIDRSFNDDRSFSYILDRHRTESKIASLVSGMGDESLKMELSSAYRSFLLRNLRTARCGENVIKPDAELPRYIANANFLFREKPLTVDDVSHSDIKESAEIVSFWRSPNAVRLRQVFRDLREARSKEGITPDDWSAMFDQAMEKMESWDPSRDETESDVFNQKAVLLRTSYDIVPEGKPRESLTRRFVKLLESSPLQKESFIEWLFHARWLVNKDPEIFAQTVVNSPSHNLRMLIAVGNAGG